MGTPHQGGSALDQVETLPKFMKVNNRILQHLGKESEYLELQLAQYASISSKFVTAYAHEVYPSQLASGKAVVLVPTELAIAPDNADGERIAIFANHQDMVRFVLKEDNGYKKVLQCLILMAGKV
ncbi:MAG: hypothetical protein M1840_006390 [Geoglossum simile]|nr:MAG: hypothetical protein M1840_006390 [Geoglossum simile]